MSIFVWVKDSSISKVCDADVQKHCLKAKPQLAKLPGQVLACLEEVQAKPAGDAQLQAVCSTLISVAEPPDEKLEFDNNFRVRFSG